MCIVLPGDSKDWSKLENKWSMKFIFTVKHLDTEKVNKSLKELMQRYKSTETE